MAAVVEASSPAVVSRCWKCHANKFPAVSVGSGFCEAGLCSVRSFGDCGAIHGHCVCDRSTGDLLQCEWYRALEEVERLLCVCTVDVLPRLRDKLFAVIIVLPNSGHRMGFLSAFGIT